MKHVRNMERFLVSLLKELPFIGFQLNHYQETNMMHRITITSYLERNTQRNLSSITLRAIALIAVLSGGVAVMGAQTTAQASSTAGVVAQQPNTQEQPSQNTTASSSNSLFSTSANEETDALVTEASVTPATPDFSKMMQYGAGPQGYNRPRYQSGYQNADNSNKWLFYGGAGFSQTVGNTWHYLTPNFGLQVGGGRRFNKHLALPVEFDYDYFGSTRQTLANQSTIYFGENGVGLDGNSHIWSFSIQPTYTFYSGDAWGAYIVGGVGYYHKVANFTLPAVAEGCYGFYCGLYAANVNIDHYTSNAPGYDGGFGITYKLSHFSNTRLYAEARYVFIDNSQRQGVTINNYPTAPTDSTDFYPANSNRTTYIPIKAGFRF